MVGVVGSSPIAPTKIIRARFRGLFCACILRDSGSSMHDPAEVAELVDALGLDPSGATRESSSLSFRTKLFYEQRVFHSCKYLLNLLATCSAK